MALDAVGGALLIQLDYHSPAYANAFRIYLIALVVLRLGAAAELYERISEHFLGIGRFRLGGHPKPAIGGHLKSGQWDS